MPEPISFAVPGSDRPALTLAGQVLTVWQQGRARRVRSWEIPGIRWLDHEHAELHLGTDERLVLPPVEDLAAAVQAIDEFAVAAPDRRRQQVARQLHQRHYFQSRGPGHALVAGLRVVVLAIAAMCCVVVGTGERGAPPDWRLAALVFAVALLGLLPVAANVTSRGIRIRMHRVPWSDVLNVGTITVFHGRSRHFELPVHTRFGVEAFTSGFEGDCRLIKGYVESRHLWPGVEFKRAGPVPPPDNALSRARETGKGADVRGLSQSAKADP